MTIDLTTPEWQTALATWALFVVTLFAVIVGGIAAVSASRAYALEAEPVIIIRRMTFSDGFNQSPDAKSALAASPIYVISPNPTIADGITIRPYDAINDDPNYGKSGVVSQPPKKPGADFVLQNIGRSPAVDVIMTWRLETPIFDGKPDLENLKTRMQVGRSKIQKIALPPQQIIYLRIENHTGNSVRISVDPIGTQKNWQGSRRNRRPINIIADAELWEVKAP